MLTARVTGTSGHGHTHTHGLVDPSIKRSREGLRAVGLALAVLGLTAVAQLAIFVASGSIALLADLVHNFGDAATAIPLGIAFALRSARAERGAGLFVVAVIFFSACVAGFEAISRLINPETPTHLVALAGAGVVGYLGNWVAAGIRTRAGRRLDSPALIADGNHARADAYVSLAVVASAAAVAAGVPIADPLIGLAITLVILRITWDSWKTVRGHDHSPGAGDTVSEATLTVLQRPGTAAPEPGAPSPQWMAAARKAKLLSWISLVWMGFEGGIAIVAGVIAGSVALIGFGLDSGIEGVASLVIIWRFTGSRIHSARRRGARPEARRDPVLHPRPLRRLRGDRPSRRRRGGRRSACSAWR